MDAGLPDRIIKGLPQVDIVAMLFRSSSCPRRRKL